MRNGMRKLLRILLLVISLVSMVIFLGQKLQNRQGRETYDQALAIAQGSSREPAQPKEEPREELAVTQSPEEAAAYWTPAPMGEDANLAALEEIDLAALQEINPDVIGWICIPNTQINYPILQGQDNDFYLSHTWEKTPNVVGSVFMEYRNSADFTDYNTILYAHNMNDGSMFADVSNYSAPWYYDHYPYIYIVLHWGILRYEVFSCYQAPVDSVAYGLSFRQKQTREEFLSFALEQALVDTGIVPAITDQILTLSTCTGTGYDERWVAHGRLPMIKVTNEK